MSALRQGRRIVGRRGRHIDEVSARVKSLRWPASAIRQVLLILCLTLGTLDVHATGSDRLQTFMNSTRSMRAQFEQTIVDRNGKLTQSSNGTFEFARPGRFRWVYLKPDPQTIVSDGQTLWLYDPELNQVTRRKLDQALGATPAALLAGNVEVLKAFALADEPDQGALQWVRATPRERDTSFGQIRMGFSAEGIAAMELIDGFGQRTRLNFSALERNPSIDAGQFRFSPPSGADVVGN